MTDPSFARSWGTGPLFSLRFFGPIWQNRSTNIDKANYLSFHYQPLSETDCGRWSHCPLGEGRRFLVCPTQIFLPPIPIQRPVKAMERPYLRMHVI